MRSFNLLATLFITLIATSNARPGAVHFETRQDYSSQGDAIQGFCKRIRALTMFANMVTNQTTFNDIVAQSHLNQEQIEFIKTQTTKFVAELDSLTSNTTLTGRCEIINAHNEVVKQCKKLTKLERSTELANNQTALNEHLAGETLNQKQVEQLKKNMESAEINLQEMRGNSTLIRLCTSEIELQQNEALQQDGTIGNRKLFTITISENKLKNL